MVTVEEHETTLAVAVRPVTLAAALANASAYASADKYRPILNAALLVWTPESLRVVATDSYQLLVQDMPRIDGEGSGRFLLGRDDAVRFAKLAKGSHNVSLSFDGDNVTLITPGASASARQVPGDFPNWEMLISLGELERGTAGASVSFPVRSFKLIAGLQSLAGTTAKACSILFEPNESTLKPARYELIGGHEPGQRVLGLVMPNRS